MRIYISGKMTGLDREEYQKKFRKAASMLRDRGHAVVNPAENDFDLNYWGYMRLDFMLIEMCDAVYLLPGWEESDGARLEREYAKHLGKEIYERISDC